MTCLFSILMVASWPGGRPPDDTRPTSCRH